MVVWTTLLHDYKYILKVIQLSFMCFFCRYKSMKPKHTQVGLCKVAYIFSEKAAPFSMLQYTTNTVTIIHKEYTKV